MKIILTRSVPVPPDPKPLKIKKVLENSEHDVEVISWKRDDSFGEIEGVVYFRLKAKYGTGLRNLPKMFLWQIFLFWKLMTLKYDVIHSFDLDTGIVGAIVSKIRKKRFIYEILDPFFESRRLPRWLLKFVKILEELVCKKADIVIVVDDNRLKNLKIDGSKIRVIYNVPPPFEKKVECKKERKVLVYVGILQRDRGLIEAVRAIEDLKDWELWIAGFGEIEESIIDISNRVKNVKFLGKVSYEKALELESCADAILITYDPSVSNNRRSSPNKFYEALMLKKPVIVSEGTGIDDLVRKYELGIVVRYGNVEDLKKALRKLRYKPENAQKLYEERFSWEIFKEKIREIYELL